MSTSNLYAQKIFAEHPLALWALDENIGFVSLVPGTADKGRNLADIDYWTTSTCTITEYDKAVFPFFKHDTYVNKISIATPPDSKAIITSYSAIDVNNDEFSVCFYYFSENPFLSNIRIGFKDGESAEVWSPNIDPDKFFQWNFASATFKKQTHSTNPKILIEFTGDNSSVFVNGLSIGKYAESFAKTNLGANKEAMDVSFYASGVIGSQYGVSSARYAGSNNSAYYIVDTHNALLAKPSFPMVYGSSNSVTILPGLSEGTPGMIFPGHRFLDNSDKYKTRTFEAWLRIRTSANDFRRIFGPIYSTDGLYVHDAFLALKIGSQHASYYVGEWDRPMLIQIVLSLNSAQLFVNSDLVASLSIDTATHQFSYYIDEHGNDQDWLAFYAHSDVPEIDIDCVAIYNYEIGKERALLHYSYAQSVEYPDNIIGAHDGQSIVPDYSVARYPNNQNYGSKQQNSWKLGVSENMVIGESVLSTPKPSYIPSVVFEGGMTQEMYFTDLTTAVGSSEPYITLKPHSGYDTTESYIGFPSINTLFSDIVDAIYLVMERTEDNSAPQTLFRILDPISGDYYEAYIQNVSEQGPLIYHIFVSNGTETILDDTDFYDADYAVGNKFATGIFIGNFKNGDNGTDLELFFRKSNLAMYVGGTENFTRTFTGKIYNVSFDNSTNKEYSQPPTDASNGSFYYGPASDAQAHIPTYGLIAKKVVDKIEFDISAKSYWIDSIPLSLFATYQPGSNSYSLDYVQLNIDYPKPANIVDGVYDTSNSSVKLYAYFQSMLAERPELPNYREILKTPENGVVLPDAGWGSYVYDVVDGTILYMPDVPNITNYKLTLHIETSIDGLVNNPVAIRTLQVASQSLRRDGQPHKIGARFATELEYYGEDANGVNPIVLPKTAEPYYYLSSKSGMRILGDFDLENEHGYRLVLNEAKADNFNINSMQMTIRHLDAFPAVEQPLLRLNAFDESGTPEQYSFYIVQNTDTSDLRGRVVAKYSLDGAAETDLSTVKFFYNGTDVDDLILSLGEWASISVNFTKPVNVNSDTGSIDFCGPMLLANFAYTQTIGASDTTPISISDRWVDTLYENEEIAYWDQYDTEKTWDQVAAVGELNTGVVVGFDSEELYQTYSGTGRIVGNDDDSKPVITELHRYKVYTAISSTNSLIRVV